jgi:integrase
MNSIKLYGNDETTKVWLMPIMPENYERGPLTCEEYSALTHLVSQKRLYQNATTLSAKETLRRLERPLEDVYSLRHKGKTLEYIYQIKAVIRYEMHQRRKTFWDWSAEEWLEIICPTVLQFQAKYMGAKRIRRSARPSIIDVAYLLGDVTDLWTVGMSQHATEAACSYFGKTYMAQQMHLLLDALAGLGYGQSTPVREKMQRCLSILFLMNHHPSLKDISEELLVQVGSKSKEMRQQCQKIRIGLEQLGYLLPEERESSRTETAIDHNGMSQEWFAWCQAWYERDVHLAPRIRKDYMFRLLAIGRWLQQNVPQVQIPEQWTEDLALAFRSDLCSWKNGQYSSERGRHLLEIKGQLGHPLGAEATLRFLTILKRFLIDLVRLPHSVHGEAARRITLDFYPKDVLTYPNHLKRAADMVNPRDIDLKVWAKLTIAAATLSESDLSRSGTRYPLSFFRALSLLWVTSARRPNEIMRLRLDCAREDWEPTMLDEENEPVEHLPQEINESEADLKQLKICYLHIPSSKYSGPFWIWIPDYVVDAINVWKQERPPNQRKHFDRKDHAEVDYLFCNQNVPLGRGFINRVLIPTLCAKAGVDIEDAKGKITGHRGRSTRLTLLRSQGVSLDDLAEYAGHTNTKTIRRYARQHPLQLHRIIKAADDLSRVIEGIVDVQAAAQGLPALRWFIGYDADGDPMYCGNQVYHTCPHRLDCVKCGMFIGGEKAKLLHEGENTLPVTSNVPMTPVEKCEVEGDQEGAEVCRAALQQEATPEVADIHLIFNPEGLSNHELEKLGELATPEALDKLRQALNAHEKRFAETQQHKTGRNALVGAQRKRITFIQRLIADCEQRSERKRKGKS